MKTSSSLRLPRVVVLILFAILLAPNPARADSATWNLNPISNDWNTATNWMPNTVPNGPTDTATFATSQTTAITPMAPTEVNSIIFSPGAPMFTITSGLGAPLTVSGTGIVNNSGLTQSFVSPAGPSTGPLSIFFTNGASAGMQTTFTNSGAAEVNGLGGLTQFSGTASAGSATFTNETGKFAGGVTEFLDDSTAGQGTFINTGGLAAGGSTIFRGNSTAGTASFINDNGTNGDLVGGVDFYDNASADHGVFTNNGRMIFSNNSTAGNGTFTTDGNLTIQDTASAGNANFTFFNGSNLDMYGGTLSKATVTAKGGASNSSTVLAIRFSSTADHATLIANGGSEIRFEFGATAAEATLTINPARTAGAAGGSLVFENQASAGDSNITVNGAAVTGDIVEGILTFTNGNDVTAANATIVATGGSNGGKGGLVQFLPNAQGGTCRIELLGNSQLDMAADRDFDLTIGSLEGEGTVTLGGHALVVGSNNLSTAFSGLIQDGFGVGAIAKIGTGTLTLTGANSYTGGTTVSSGILLVSNLSDSGTGTGAVSVNAGTLGGSGIIAGTVTVGTNTGIQAFLAPSKGVKNPATLTIQGSLTLNDDSTFIYKLNTNRAMADQVIANGVTIDSGAKFSFRPFGTSTLTIGQVFTAINNTAETSIVGTFHNLRDGQIIAVNGSNLQASYTGGDGNDLTLTVVP
jgi:autotransporter-associated beta strand protein